MSENYFETTSPVETPPPAPLVINDRTREILGATVKWSKFLAVLCLVYCGFLLLGAISMCMMGGFVGERFTSAADLKPLSMALFGVIYIVLAVVYFFPAIYLYRFSERLPQALADNNIDEVNTALDYHRKYYKYIGIFVIITIAVYMISLPVIFFFLFKSMAAGTF